MKTLPILILALFAFYCGLPAPATAGPLSGLRGKISGILHHSSSEHGNSAKSCPCNSAECTGQPGCACGEAGCTCNGPTQVMKQDAPKPRPVRRSLLNRQPSAAAPASPPSKQPAASRPKTAPAEDGASLNPDEQRILIAINDYRAARKLSPLRADPLLLRIARQRVGVFNHYQPAHGGWVHEQASRLGYVATDDIAQGYESPEAAVGDGSTGWGDERPGHTVGHDMQMKGFTKINGQWVNQHFDLCGVAHEGKNWIAVFGRRDS